MTCAPVLGYCANIIPYIYISEAECGSYAQERMRDHRKGERVKEIVRIERMGYGAEAIAHAADGKTLFVAGGVPGDVDEVEITQSKKAFSKARVVHVIEPSPDRISKLPVDAVESGATWAHLDYATQLDAKQANVRDALRRVGGFSSEAVDGALQPIVACKDEWGYRNKVELAAFRDGQGRFCLGAHETGSDRRLALASAPLANRLIAKAPKALTGVLRYLQGSDDLGIHRVGVRGSLRTKDVEVALWTPPSSFPRNFAAKAIKDAIGATSVVRVLAHEGSARRIKKVEVLDGAGCWHEKMGWKVPHATVGEDVEASLLSEPARFDFSVSAPSFFQVNTPQAEALVGLVLDGLQVAPGMDAADLYSGAGTFSLPLAQLGANVTAVELAGSSSRDLVRNADGAGLDIDVVCDDAAIALPNLGKLDALVVDPPRTGLEERVVHQIADASPATVAYVSCDPQTLARDLKRFAECGYHMRKVTPVDMFPQTYHVECVAILDR